MRCLIIAEIYIHTYLHLFQEKQNKKSIHFLSLFSNLTFLNVCGKMICLKTEMVVVLWNSLWKSSPTYYIKLCIIRIESEFKPYYNGKYPDGYSKQIVCWFFTAVGASEIWRDDLGIKAVWMSIRVRNEVGFGAKKLQNVLLIFKMRGHRFLHA